MSNKHNHHSNNKPFFSRTWVMILMALIFIVLLLYFMFTQDIIDIFSGVANE